MRVSVDKGNAVVTLGGSFDIIFGKDVSKFDSCSLWVITEPDSFLANTDLLISAGIRLACTYPVWVSFPQNVRDTLRDVTHVFQSFNEPFPLPFGLTLYAVPSGTACTNFRIHGRGQSMLIAGKSSWSAESIYRQCWTPDLVPITHLVVPEFQVDVSVPISEFRRRIRDGLPVNIQCSDPVIASVLAIELADFIASLPEESQGLIAIDGKICLDRVPALFEWLHGSFQNYLLRCVRYVADRNLSSKNLVVSDLVHEGRVIVSSIDSRNSCKVFISPIVRSAGIRFAELSGVEELAQFYRVSSDRICSASNPLISVPLDPLPQAVPRPDEVIEHEGGKAIIRDGHLVEIEIAGDDVSFLHLVV